MSGFIDNKFGIFPAALKVHEKCAEIISSNLANEHTPNFKAQALDFKTALADCKTQLINTATNAITDSENKVAKLQNLTDYVKYRSVLQASLDGNTVNGHLEQTAFAENSVRYLAALHFIGDKYNNLITAIKGTG